MFKVGDFVHSDKFGLGKVIHISLAGIYRVIVNFRTTSNCFTIVGHNHCILPNKEEDIYLIPPIPVEECIREGLA